MSNGVVPKIIFIIPYRDRENQKNLFLRQMAYVLEDLPPTDYKIYFAEQDDQRDFNRGAMKNIGFLAMKEMYSDDYKNITFVFNDVDTMPYEKNLLNYVTYENNIKHFFGYSYTLGGIVSITGADFEKIGGYPNFWCWGYEDNMLQKRALAAKIRIDRDQFYKVGCKEIIQFADEMYKSVNRNEFDRYVGNRMDGVGDISSLQYTIDEDQRRILITRFETPYKNTPENNTMYDIRTPSRQPFAAGKPNVAESLTEQGNLRFPLRPLPLSKMMSY